jgi:hypothetical protein
MIEERTDKIQTIGIEILKPFYLRTSGQEKNFSFHIRYFILLVPIPPDYEYQFKQELDICIHRYSLNQNITEIHNFCL